MINKKIGIVTDSTADIEPSWYQKNDVVMVPLEVRFGTETFRDWQDILPDEFYSRLRTAKEIPKTSQPPVASFIDVYNEVAKDNDEIISVHISSKLSGTLNSAEVAAKDVSVSVKLVDTQKASFLTGIIVQELVAARDRGAGMNELLDLADGLIEKSQCFFYVDTLKYLEMGGRLGKASALIGSLLNIKVILKLEDGEVATAAKIRGASKVVPALIEQVNKHSEGGSNRIGFAYSDDLSDLDLLKSSLTEEGYDISDAPVAMIGAVIGTYTGPGAYAVIVY